MLTPSWFEKFEHSLENDFLADQGRIFRSKPEFDTGINLRSERPFSGFGNEQSHYFERITNMNLKNPQIVGFGISNNDTFTQATEYAKGAIIGSAFIKHLTNDGVDKIDEFVGGILNS